MKAKKYPISLKGILNAVHRSEETGRLEHRPRSGRPSVSANRAPVAAPGTYHRFEFDLHLTIHIYSVITKFFGQKYRFSV